MPTSDEAARALRAARLASEHWSVVVTGIEKGLYGAARDVALDLAAPAAVTAAQMCAAFDSPQENPA